MLQSPDCVMVVKALWTTSAVTKGASEERVEEINDDISTF